MKIRFPALGFKSPLPALFLSTITWTLLLTILAPPFAQVWAKSSNDKLEVVSMNLRWYGSKKFPPHNDEERDEHLQRFFKTYYKTTDVFLFQEITAPARLQTTLGTPYKCLSTRDRGTSYQYVVTCYNSKTLKPLDVTQSIHDTDRAFDISFKIFGLRDALYLKFQSVQNPKKHVHTINLHLRANPMHSEFRVQQMALLFDQILEQGLHKEKGLIIGGDLNAFNKEATSNKKDDIYLYLAEADRRSLELHTEFALPTHLSSGNNRFFDYLLVPKANWLNSYDMFIACSMHASKDPESYENPRYYKTYISDHCPISLQVPLRDL